MKHFLIPNEYLEANLFHILGGEVSRMKKTMPRKLFLTRHRFTEKIFSEGEYFRQPEESQHESYDTDDDTCLGHVLGLDKSG